MVYAHVIIFFFSQAHLTITTALMEENIIGAFGVNMMKNRKKWTLFGRCGNKLIVSWESMYYVQRM